MIPPCQPRVPRLSRKPIGLPALALFIALLAACTNATTQTTALKAAFWPPYPDEPRIQFLTSFNTSSDLSKGRSLLDDLAFGKEPVKNLPIIKPYGVTIHKGRIYICDLGGGCIIILDLLNRQTLVMGKTGNIKLEQPTDIAITPDGVKYVADLSKKSICVFDANDRAIAIWGRKDLNPTGIAAFENELFICNFATRQVEVWNRHTGQMLRVIGSPGQEQGQFIRPLGVDVDTEGNVYIMDVMACVLQKFDRQGKLLTRFGSTSDRLGGFLRPKCLSVDRNGIIYVVDAMFDNVQLFNQKGQLLTFFGSRGNHPGAMYLPVGISVTDTGLDLFKQYVHPAFEAQQLILVTNQFGANKVSIYAMGKLRPGKTVEDISSSQGLVPVGTTTAPAAKPTPTTLPDIIDTAPAPGPHAGNEPTTRPDTGIPK